MKRSFGLVLVLGMLLLASGCKHLGGGGGGGGGGCEGGSCNSGNEAGGGCEGGSCQGGSCSSGHADAGDMASEETSSHVGVPDANTARPEAEADAFSIASNAYRQGKVNNPDQFFQGSPAQGSSQLTCHGDSQGGAVASNLPYTAGVRRTEAGANFVLHGAGHDPVQVPLSLEYDAAGGTNLAYVGHGAGDYTYSVKSLPGATMAVYIKNAAGAVSVCTGPMNSGNRVASN